MKKRLLGLAIAFTLLLAGCGNSTDEVTHVTFEDGVTTVDDATIEEVPETETPASNSSTSSISLSSIPEYSSSPYTTINNNVPDFSASDMSRTDAFEIYSDLDSLGRCGVAYANICKEIMPTEKRGDIGSVKPSGWHTAKYSGLVDGNYLYNRCHLIGYQLSGENANEKNLITGTRYLNVKGMLPFENMVDDYVDETNNHVLYRVTPVFEGDNLVASGVQMEAYSVEDSGAGISFNVYCYNVQPGITINYATGDSALSGEDATESVNSSSTATTDTNSETPATATESSTEAAYIVNTKNGTLHTASCNHGPEPQNSASYSDLTSAEAASAAIHGSIKYCGFCMK